LNDRATEIQTTLDERKEHDVTSEDSGENMEGGFGADELAVASVIYVGRGSFRMEAVALEPELARPGVVHAVAGVVTAPLHSAPRKPSQTSQSSDDGLRGEDGRGPRLRSLFGSQVDVPLLAAPSGSITLRATGVTLSRSMLATVCGLVLLCGIVVGTAARHLTARPAPLAVVASPAVAAVAVPLVAPAPLASAPAVETVPPSPPPVVALPAPVTIRVRPRTAAKPVAAAVVPKAPILAGASKPWVDPWAE
jgi:hypothetical protein